MSDEPRKSHRPQIRRDYPYIHPERLPEPEHLAVDAEDVEEFIDHYEHSRHRDQADGPPR